jgi:electron transport complex protein RnfD
MLDVIAALFPSVIAAVILFGPQALFLIAVSVFTCVASEYISRRIMKRENTIGDLSAVVTGILLAFNVPVGINPFALAFGGVAAIVVVKQMFGGIGQNFVNPALTARIILMSSFPSQMSTWAVPFYYLHQTDAMTTASPLNILKTGADGTMPTLLNMFVGVRAGCLGETCSVALILGGVYLVLRKVISPVIPVCYVGTAALISLIAGRNVAFDVLAGGLLLGAIFMATDYATSPITFRGKIVYAVGAGIITMLIRIYGALPEGVSFSIILMNIMVPHIERLTRPRAFGKERAKQ